MKLPGFTLLHYTSQDLRFRYLGAMVHNFFWIANNSSKYFMRESDFNIFGTISQVSFHISCKFRIIFLSLQHRSVILWDEPSDLILWERRFLTSVVVYQESRKFQTHSRQMTMERLRSAFLYTLLYIVRAGVGYFVVCPVWVGQCESLWYQDGQKNRHLRLFCIISIPETICNLPIEVSGRNDAGYEEIDVNYCLFPPYKSGHVGWDSLRTANETGRLPGFE